MSRITFLLVLIGLAGCSWGVPAAVGPPAKVSVQKPGFPLKGTIDLGVVIQGTSVELRAWVKNQGTAPIEAANIATSCECLTVRLSKKQISAGERVLVYLQYDGSKEAEFVGSLQIEVNVTDAAGVEVGRIDVPIEVVKENAVGDARD